VGVVKARAAYVRAGRAVNHVAAGPARRSGGGLARSTEWKDPGGSPRDQRFVDAGGEGDYLWR